MSIVVLNKVDKIKTTSGTVIDLENIQASGGSAALEGSGISYSTDGTDEFYEAGTSSDAIALDINNPTTGQALVYDDNSKTWKNAAGVSGSGSTISDFGITLDTSGPDNIWSMDATLPTTTAFVVEKEQKTDGSVEFIFPAN